jgi:translocation-and-assembly-module (TAM) inner membrane subunit TamB-like protein
MSDPLHEPALKTAPKKRRLGRLRRIWKWTWRTSAVLLVAAYVSRNSLLGPWLLDQIEPKIAELLGAPVELEGISGSWVGGIDLASARSLEDGQLTPLRSFELTGIELRYSLWELARGEAEWLHAVRAKNATLILDAAQGQDSPETEEDSAPLALPARLPELQIEQLAVLYEDGETSAEIRRGSVLTLAEPVGESASTPTTAAALLANRLQINLPDFRFIRDGMRAPVATLACEVVYADRVLRIPSLLIDGIERLERAKFDLGKTAEGELSFDFAASVLDGAIAAKGSFKELRVRAEIEASGLIAEQLQPWLDLGLRGRLDCKGRVDWPLDQPLAGVAEFEFGAAQNGWRLVELEAISGRIRLAEGWLISDHFEAHGPDLNLLAQNCRIPLFAESLESASTSGSFQLQVGEFPAWLRRLELELPSEVSALQSLQLDAQLDSSPQRVIVVMRELALTTRFGRWTARGSIELPELQLKPESPIELDLVGSEVDLAQLRAFLTAHGRVDTAFLPLAGTAGLHLSLSGTAGDPEFELGLLLQNLDPGTPHPEVPPGPYQAQFKLQYGAGVLALEPAIVTGPHLEWSAHAEYQIALDLAELAAGHLPSLAGAVSLRTDLRADPPRHVEGIVQLDAELETRLDDDGLPTQSHLSWKLSSPGLAIAEAELRLASFTLEGEGDWLGLRPFPQRTRAGYQLTGLQYQGAAAFSAQGDTDFADKQLSSNIRLAETDGGALAEVSLSLPIDLQQFDAQPDGAFALRVDLDQPLELTRLENLLGSFGIELIPAEQGLQIAGLVDLQIVGEGSWSDPRISASFSATRVTLTPTQQHGRPPLPGPLDLNLTLSHQGGVTELSELLATTGPMMIDVTGTWSLEEALLPLLRSGQPLPEGELRLTGHAALPDVSFLANLPGIRRIEGALDAEIEVTGSDRAPIVRAEWALHRGALRLDDPSLAAFDRLEFAGTYDGELALLHDCHGELGSAPFVATGSVDLRGEIPLVDVRFDGTDLLLFRRQGVKIRSDTGLRVHGPLNALTTSGELSLTDGRYTKPVDFILPLLRRGQPPSRGVEGISLFSLEAPLDTMKLDLRVRPGSGFRIKTNVANGLIRPDLRLVGTGEVPYLLGEIYFDQTILTMPAHRITIEQGVIRFKEDNPFVPTLDIRASFRRYGYDVTILVEGDVTAPIITMSSVPPLESEELLLFTTTGQPPLEAANAQAALGTVAVYLAQDWLRRFFGDLSTEEEESLFDRIEIEIGRDATNQGSETIEGRFLLRRDNFFENDALYLTGERDAYSDFNLGLRIRFLFP